MKSKDKIKVVLRPMPRYDNKWWAVVTFVADGHEWIPSFEDLFRIVKAIARAEDFKYPPRKNYQGYKMVQKILCDACEPGTTWKQMKAKYKIPTRE